MQSKPVDDQKSVKPAANMRRKALAAQESGLEDAEINVSKKAKSTNNEVEISSRQTGETIMTNNLVVMLDALRNKLVRCESKLEEIHDQIQRLQFRAKEVKAEQAGFSTRVSDYTAKIERQKMEIKSIELTLKVAARFLEKQE